MKKVIVLVDGQNLFYSLKDLNLKEREINWGEFLKSFLEPDDELIRTYWFRPQKIQDGHLNMESIKNQIIFWDYKNYYTDFRENTGKIPKDILQKITDEVKVVCDWIEEVKRSFAQIEYNYDQLCLEHDDIEMVKTGIVKINPYKKNLFK